MTSSDFSITRVSTVNSMEAPYFPQRKTQRNNLSWNVLLDLFPNEDYQQLYQNPGETLLCIHVFCSEHFFYLQGLLAGYCVSQSAESAGFPV